MSRNGAVSRRGRHSPGGRGRGGADHGSCRPPRLLSSAPQARTRMTPNAAVKRREARRLAPVSHGSFRSRPEGGSREPAGFGDPKSGPAGKSRRAIGGGVPPPRLTALHPSRLSEGRSGDRMSKPRPFRRGNGEACRDGRGSAKRAAASPSPLERWLERRRRRLPALAAERAVPTRSPCRSSGTAGGCAAAACRAPGGRRRGAARASPARWSDPASASTRHPCRGCG
jgi:hypothetical protein